MKLKLKTHQATAKRFRQTAGKKFLKRHAGQDHFNSRDRGVRTMSKRRDESVAEVNVPAVKRLLPYSS